MTPTKKLSEMTESEKLQAVAAFDGWSDFLPDRGIGLYGTPANWGDYGSRYHQLPDYLHDLNAICAAVEKLDELQKLNFFVNLCLVVLGLTFNGQPIPVGLFDRLVNATADQRTDTLILTIGAATL